MSLVCMLYTSDRSCRYSHRNPFRIVHAIESYLMGSLASDLSSPAAILLPAAFLIMIDFGINIPIFLNRSSVRGNH